MTVAQATRTLAPAPVPSGRWEDPDAIAETVQAWLEESLLRGDLLQAFDVCQTPRALSRYLERASATGWSHAAAGEADPGCSNAPRRSWAATMRSCCCGLTGDCGALVGSVGLARPAAVRRPRRRCRRGRVGARGLLVAALPSSERSDPVLSTPDLRRYLTGLLERLQQAVSGRHLDVSFRRRFAYAYASATVALEEAEELSDDSSPAHNVAVADAARIALADLTGRQLRVLIERPQGTLEDLAARLGVSRGTVDNEYRRALVKVRDAAPTDTAFDGVLETVLLLASEEKTS